MEEAPTERTAQEITAPFRPRLRCCGRSVRAPSVPKNSQTRPRAARDPSSEPPRRTPALGRAVKVCTVAAAGMQAEGVRRGLGMESSRLFGSPQRRGQGGQTGCCAPSPCFKSAPGESAPAAARPPAAARLHTLACTGRDLIRALSDQPARGVLLRKPLGPQAAPDTCRQQRCRAGGPTPA